MDIIIKGHEFFYDISSILMLFFPGEKATFVSRSKKDLYICSLLTKREDKLFCVTKIKFQGKIYKSQKTTDINYNSKDLVKFTFYNACKKATAIESDWGTLTGIRPISVYEKIRNSKEDPQDILLKRYLLKPEKINILKQIYNVQQKVTKRGKSDVSVYISIPFCPSKCTYCSFISISAVNKEKLKKQYLDLLIREIELKSLIIKKYNLKVCSLYVGGGTPGVLSVDELQVLLNSIKQNFDVDNIKEKCFEIGRPDTVIVEKLEILKRYGYDRICINTQTTNDKILSDVNRKHSSKQYFDSINLSKKYGFNCINTDLIAGLPGETFQSFKKSVDDIIKAGIENITIHTLSIKRSSTLSQSNEHYNPKNDTVNKMLEYAYDTLNKNGYLPYYIYRQKNCVSNGENIGFFKDNKPCLYNIYMMEDYHSIIACGAGASSKIINNGDVNRVINIKYPIDYVADFYRIYNNTKKLDDLLKEIF